MVPQHIQRVEFILEDPRSRVKSSHLLGSILPRSKLWSAQGALPASRDDLLLYVCN